MALPPGMLIEAEAASDGDYRTGVSPASVTITRRWLRAKHYVLLVVVLGMGGSAAFAWMEYGFSVWLVLGTIWVFAWAHMLLSMFLNRTVIRAGRAGVDVSHGPIPTLMYRSMSVSAADLRQLYAARCGAAYAIKAQLADGSVVDLVRPLVTAEQAIFIEQQLERALGHVDFDVPGLGSNYPAAAADLKARMGGAAITALAPLPIGGEGPAYRPGALPRLVTPRSRRAADGKHPKLQKPDVDGEWDWRFKKFFLGFGGGGNSDGKPFAECTRRFLGPELTPGGIYRLVFRRDDESASLRELRARRFRKTRSMSEPHVAESDAWLVDRMLNGFHPVLFRRAAGADDVLEVRFDWDDYDFTDVNREKHWGLAAQEGSKQQYELPNLRAELTRDGDALALAMIEVTYRKGPRLRRASADRPMEHEPTVVYAAGGANWGYAKRLLRCQLALTYEMDQHLARGHLLVEQYLAALETTLASDHPLYGLLKPYLRSVDRINAFGDLLVMGETGAIRNASALSARSVEQRLVEQIGGLDWRGFRPRSPVVASHRFAHAAAIFWRVIETFVAEHVAASFTEAHWTGVEAFSKRLTERSPPYVPYLGDESIDWLDRSELASHGRAPGEPSMSRVSADPARRTADLVALATHAIYHATFVHTWTNDRQFEDVGDPGYASFGLMSRRAPPLSGSPTELEAWEREADPLIRDAGFQMTVARILTHMDWGHLIAPASKRQKKEPCMREEVEDGSPVHARLRELLCAERDTLAALHDGDPFANRHERDAVDVKNFRSVVNT